MGTFAGNGGGLVWSTVTGTLSGNDMWAHHQTCQWGTVTGSASGALGHWFEGPIAAYVSGLQWIKLLWGHFGWQNSTSEKWVVV